MAYDVSGRLGQGRPPVETMAAYVWAAHQVGFADPDLTLHPGQMRDWYGTEDGMDLVVLQRDCAAVDAAVRATREALTGHEDQAGMLSEAWQGSGAQAARQFLHRHGVAAAAVADALTAAAAALQRALEQLWRAVDSKVETTVAIEAEAGAAREQWLAAATTVTSGVGDRAAAAEMVDGAVKPFVQNRIGAEWLTAMQAAGATVAETYRTATAEIMGRPPAVFEIPGALGPSAPSAPVASSVPAAPSPVAVSAPAPAPALAPAPTAPAAWTAPPPPAAAPPAPLPEAPPAPLSDLGGGGAFPQVGQRFADALGGLLGGGTGDGIAGDAFDPPADLEPPEPDEPEDDEPDDEEPEDGEESEDEESEEQSEEPITDEPATEEPFAESVSAEPEPEAVVPPEPTPLPPPAEPLPPPPTEERTPCEIAADEVPQVGPPPVTETGGG
ncbi:hypothetical protein [Mycobacterium kyogaense]|uniref:hypothetical protein n=1 Tax=Mycobacterium kyogaense TaxID=2212479 RepID=UPI001F094B9C|nr:hypothetical protein [Mycobacterium kyogaense]